MDSNAVSTAEAQRQQLVQQQMAQQMSQAAWQAQMMGADQHMMQHMCNGMVNFAGVLGGGGPPMVPAPFSPHVVPADVSRDSGKKKQAKPQQAGQQDGPKGTRDNWLPQQLEQFLRIIIRIVPMGPMGWDLVTAAWNAEKDPIWPARDKTQLRQKYYRELEAIKSKPAGDASLSLVQALCKEAQNAINAKKACGSEENGFMEEQDPHDDGDQPRQDQQQQSTSDQDAADGSSGAKRSATEATGSSSAPATTPNTKRHRNDARASLMASLYKKIGSSPSKTASTSSSSAAAATAALSSDTYTASGSSRMEQNKRSTVSGSLDNAVEVLRRVAEAVPALQGHSLPSGGVDPVMAFLVEQARQADVRLEAAERRREEERRAAEQREEERRRQAEEREEERRRAEEQRRRIADEREEERRRLAEEREEERRRESRSRDMMMMALMSRVLGVPVSDVMQGSEPPK